MDYPMENRDRRTNQIRLIDYMTVKHTAQGADITLDENVDPDDILCIDIETANPDRRLRIVPWAGNYHSGYVYIPSPEHALKLYNCPQGTVHITDVVIPAMDGKEYVFEYKQIDGTWYVRGGWGSASNSTEMAVEKRINGVFQGWETDYNWPYHWN